MDEIRFEWVVKESLVPKALETVENQSGRVLDDTTFFEPSADEIDYLGDSAFEPMMVIAVALSIGALIKVISDTVLEHKYPGGELYVLRKGKLKHFRVPSLEKGTIVIITEKGTERFSPAKRADGLAVLEKALRGLAGV